MRRRAGSGLASSAWRRAVELQPATKSFQLVAGETVLAEYAPDFGLVRSFAPASAATATTRRSPS
ncbi:MAG: hypothetical protein WKF47_18850 [Geodermatophilaceae bacterium]